jgi:hypothetical protein
VSISFKKFHGKGVGEPGREGLALVLEDANRALLSLRNDDAVLMEEIVANAAAQEGVLPEEREVHLHDFSQMVQGEIAPQGMRAFLRQPQVIWTWAGIREYTEQQGISPHEAIRARKALKRARTLEEEHGA